MAWARAIRVAFWDTIFRKVHCSTCAGSGPAGVMKPMMSSAFSMVPVA